MHRVSAITVDSVVKAAAVRQQRHAAYCYARANELRDMHKGSADEQFAVEAQKDAAIHSRVARRLMGAENLLPGCTNNPVIGSDQHRFEEKLKGFGINYGAMAVTATGSYANEHIEWMWQQYCVKQQRRGALNDCVC